MADGVLVLERGRGGERDIDDQLYSARVLRAAVVTTRTRGSGGNTGDRVPSPGARRVLRVARGLRPVVRAGGTPRVEVDRVSQGGSIAVQKACDHGATVHHGPDIVSGEGGSHPRAHLHQWGGGPHDRPGPANERHGAGRRTDQGSIWSGHGGHGDCGARRGLGQGADRLGDQYHRVPACGWPVRDDGGRPAN